MTYEARLTNLEERAAGLEEHPLVVIVHRPGQGPTDPIERAAWLQSRVPHGARKVMFIRVIRENRPWRPGLGGNHDD